MKAKRRREYFVTVAATALGCSAGTWRTHRKATARHAPHLALGVCCEKTPYGGSLGVDRQLTQNMLVGVAVGGSDGTFQVPTLGTSGSSTGGHVALYALATAGALYGEASSAFSAYTNHTYAPGWQGPSAPTSRPTSSASASRSAAKSPSPAAP